MSVVRCIQECFCTAYNMNTDLKNSDVIVACFLAEIRVEVDRLHVVNSSVLRGIRGASSYRLQLTPVDTKILKIVLCMMLNKRNI
jgi:hypothetical protein